MNDHNETDNHENEIYSMDNGYSTDVGTINDTIDIGNDTDDDFLNKTYDILNVRNIKLINNFTLDEIYITFKSLDR